MTLRVYPSLEQGSWALTFSSHWLLVTPGNMTFQALLLISVSGQNISSNPSRSMKKTAGAGRLHGSACPLDQLQGSSIASSKDGFLVNSLQPYSFQPIRPPQLLFAHTSKCRDNVFLHQLSPLFNPATAM